VVIDDDHVEARVARRFERRMRGRAVNFSKAGALGP
jgi:hypothetical protein